LKGHHAHGERGLRDEDESVNQYRMPVDEAKESIRVGWQANDWAPDTS
jgi:hypothetical protein